MSKNTLMENQPRKELVIMLGAPGSGKSTFSKMYFENYTRVSQDEQGAEGQWKCFLKALEDDLPGIIIDRMNFNKAQRDRYSSLARKSGYRIKIVWLDRDFNRCFSQIMGRTVHETIQPGDYETMCKAISFFFKSFEAPEREEYDELVIVK